VTLALQIYHRNVSCCVGFSDAGMTRPSTR
jgi:hypothetical protein